MFREFDGWIEGTHQAVLDNAGNGEGAAELVGEMGFDGGKGGVGRKLRRGQRWRSVRLSLFAMHFADRLRECA